MVDCIGQGAAWWGDRLAAYASRAVTYTRSTDCVDLQATIGRTRFATEDSAGVLHTTESRDFLFAAVDLVLGGETTTPRAGDRIREAIGEQVHTFLVTAPAGEPVYRYSDRGRTRIRVHAKHVATE